MEPGQVLVALLYLWLLIALGVYAWRAYRRIVHGETKADRTARRQGEAPGASPGAAAAEAADRAVTAEPAPASTPDASPAPAPARATVAELVEGIALPCGLLPVIGDDLDPYKAVFATTGHPPAEVDEALAGELGRLGYALERRTATESVARRGDEVLRVRVEPESRNGDATAVPLGAGRVIAELST